MKKWIILSERADVAGEIRFPEEGAIAVATKDANALIDAGKAKAAAAPDAAERPVRTRKARAPSAKAASPSAGASPASASSAPSAEAPEAPKDAD